MAKISKSLRRTLAGFIRSVWQANLNLKNAGLITMTWGNVSGIDRRRGIIAIKPSGVDYAALQPDDMVLTDMEGRCLESKWLPSTDLPTHLALYRAFPAIGGVAHTHSTYATAFAQACRSLPCLGTTHADYAFGEVPVTDVMPSSVIREQYEANTGRMIVRKFRQLHLQPLACPFVFVANHAPFVWGLTASAAVENAIVLETIAKIGLLTFLLGGGRQGISRALLDKHYFRKHGQAAYYGQAGIKKPG